MADIGAYGIGYLFSILAGHFFIKWIVNEIRRIEGEPPSYWQSGVLGCVERTLYTASWNFGYPQFIGVWVGIKLFTRWRRRGNPQRTGVRDDGELILYHVFLIGNALSIFYGTIGAKVTQWLREPDWYAAVSVPLILIAGSLILWVWRGPNRRNLEAKNDEAKSTGNRRAYEVQSALQGHNRMMLLQPLP